MEWGIGSGSPVDTDSDGTIDALDDDTDGDTLLDIDEAGDTDLNTPPVTTNGNPVPDWRYPDRDRDGIRDPVDNCIDTPNADQSDRDGDGVGDITPSASAIRSTSTATRSRTGPGTRTCRSRCRAGEAAPRASRPACERSLRGRSSAASSLSQGTVCAGSWRPSTPGAVGGGQREYHPPR